MQPLQPLTTDEVTAGPDVPVAPGAMTWSVRGQTTEKPNNDCYQNGADVIWRKNEDRFRFSESSGTMLATVADGAGSSGMYCGAWAEALVENLPGTPLVGVDALNGWIDGFWKDFSDTNKQRAANDPTKLTKFVREGSCSTLTACWIENGSDVKPASLDWLCYGDSHFCAFDLDGDALNLGTGFPATLGAMSADPHLLNWKDLPDEKHLTTGKIEINGPTVIVLASDGVGEFMQLRYLADVHARQVAGAHLSPHTQGLLTEFRQVLNGGSGKIADLARNHVQQSGNGFKDELATMMAVLDSQAGFADMIKEHHANGLISNDDATLVIIEASVETLDSSPNTNNDAKVINLAGEL